MKKNIFFLIPILSLGLASCAITSSQTTNEKTNEKESGNNNNNEPVISDLDLYDKDAYKELTIKSADFSIPRLDTKSEASYYDLFNLGNKISISIDMEKTEMSKLQADYETGYKSEIYRHCKSVTITMVNYDNTFSWTYEDVGIRQKGNMSRSNVYVDGEAQITHYKLSFDETFDDEEAYGSSAYDWTGRESEYQERKNREFLGLSGIDIKWNRTFDATHIREVYASKIYKAAGVLSQEIGLSEFNLNIEGGKSYDFGLCTIYEPAKKSMVKNHLKQGGLLNLPSWSQEKAGTYGVSNVNYGDLYKCSYGVGSGSTGSGANLSTDSSKGARVGVGNLSGSYIPAYERKTNTDVTYDDAPLRALTKAITSSDYTAISEVLDMEYLAAVEACNYVIGNPDDLRNNNNNYMIYIRRTDGKAILIPIDNDRCFGISCDWNPDGDGMRNTDVFATKCANGKTPNKLYQKTILASSANDCKAIYLNYVKALKVSDWMKTETFNQFYEIAKNTYGDASCVSSYDYVGFSLDAGMNYSFEDYITHKAAKINLEYALIAPKSTTNDETATETTQITDDPSLGYYGDVYIVGTFNDWNANLDSTYKLSYKGSGTYEITITVSGDSNGYICFKFNNGIDWNEINWGQKDGTLSLDSGSNFELNDVGNNDSITIILNTINKTISITNNHQFQKGDEDVSSSQKKKKFIGLLFLFLVYCGAIGLSVLVFYWATPFQVLPRVLFSALTAMAVIYIFSFIFGTTSMIDPYWSLQTPALMLLLMIYYNAFNLGTVLYFIVFCYWGIRLTWNFCHTYTDLSYEDWRYQRIRESTKKLYPLVSLAICLLLTLLVYVASIPMYLYIQELKGFGLWQLIGLFIMTLGSFIETEADAQMHHFRKNRSSRNQVYDKKLWKYMRHPNYFGEIILWVGVTIVYISADQSLWYVFLSAIPVICLFLSTIAYEEHYFLTYKPDYSIYQKNAFMLLPIPKKNRKTFEEETKHWVTMWGNAQSKTLPAPATYARNLTLRYPIYVPFDGERIRITFDNFCVSETAHIHHVILGRGKGISDEMEDPIYLSFDGERRIDIPAHQSITSDPFLYPVKEDEYLVINIYIKGTCNLTGGVDITGPLSKGYYAYGDQSKKAKLDINTSKSTGWVYFLSNIDVYTKKENECVICYGDSITSQDWPDYMQLHLKEMGIHNVAVIRKAVSGTRILREYECITYQSYGLKGKNRFNHEIGSVSGCKNIIIQQGINDIIHPVGEDVNIFRPMSDLPTVSDLMGGMDYYKKEAKKYNLKVYFGSLLPIYNWRTYQDFREKLKNDFNDELRKEDHFIDFQEEIGILKEDQAWHFKEGMDSGDHLHPSKKAYELMGCLAAEKIFGKEE